MPKPPTPWAHLPNAALIDWVWADVKRRPEVWKAAGTAWTAAEDAAQAAARDVAWTAAEDAAQAAARDVAWTAAEDVVWTAAEDVVWTASAALIAWDDCAQLLDAPVDAVRLMAAAGHHPAVLLLPAVIVKQGKEPTPS